MNTSGVPTSLSGTAGNQSAGNCFVVVWKGQTQTCSTAGVSHGFDCRGASGFNQYSVNTNADSSFYSCGNDYLVSLHGGTVAGNCISHYMLGAFSLKNRASLTPTIHGRALDVSSGGEAGIDWANIGSPQTAQRLGCTSFFQVQQVCNAVTVLSVSGAVGSVTAGVTVTTNNDKTGYTVSTVQDKTDYRLSSAGLADFMDCVISEPVGVFAWSGATLRSIAGWLGAVTSNQVKQSASQQGLCTRSGATRIAVAEVSCSAGVVTKGSFV